MNRRLLIISLGIISIWDTITTIFGIYKIAGEGLIQIGMSIGLSIVVVGFLLNTIPILKNPSKELVPIGAKYFLGLAFLTDVYFSFTGNWELILSNAPEHSKVILALVLTFLVSGSPIALSHLRFNSDDT